MSKEKNLKDRFKASDIKRIFGLSSQRLHQIRQMDIVSPSINKRGQGGTNWYSFNDLIEIAVALKLIKHGVKMTDVRDFAVLFVQLIYSDRFNQERYSEWKDLTHIFISSSKNSKGGIGFLPLDLRKKKNINKTLKTIRLEEDSFIISVEKIRENLEIKIKEIWG